MFKKLSTKLSVMVLSALALVGLLPAVAYAQTAETAGDAVLAIPQATWAIIMGTVVPVVVGIITKLAAPSWLKGFINLVLSAVAGLIATATQADGSALFTQSTLVNAAVAFVTATAMYYSIWKPLHVNEHTAPEKGLG